MLFLPIETEPLQSSKAKHRASSNSRRFITFGRRHESETVASIKRNSFGARKLISAL